MASRAASSLNSAFGVDSSSDSSDADGVGLDFGVSARCAESVEAGVDGAVAIGAPSGLAACEAAVAAAGIGVSAGCAELVEAGVGRDVAIGAASGLAICGAAGAAAGIGALARGGDDSGEARADGAVAIGAPSGPILCEGTSVAAWFSGSGVDAGAAEPGALTGSRVCSFSGLARLSAAAAEGSCSGRSGALFRKATLAQTAATPASASPPAVSFQLRERDLLDFRRSVCGPIDFLAFALAGGSPSLSICDRRTLRGPGSRTWAPSMRTVAQR